MAFVYSHPVRFADVDHAGIVYYPRFFDYFHQAFEELFRARMGARAYVDLLDKDRIGFPAVKAEAEYRAPLKFGDTAIIVLSISKLGESSITFHYQVSRDTGGDATPAVCCEGQVVCAVVDLKAFRAVAVPDRIRKLFADLVEP